MSWKSIKIILTILIIICLAVFMATTDMALVFEQLSHIGFGFLWLIALSFGAFVMGSLAWKFCFEEYDEISVKTLFFVRTIGETVTIINPTNIIAGEASKVALLQQEGISKQAKIDSILISRMILIFSQLILTALCVLFLAYRYQFLTTAVLILGIIVFLLIMSIQFLNQKTLQRKIIKAGKLRRFITGFLVQSIRFRRRFVSFLKYRKKQLALAFLCSSIHWLFGASELFVILKFLEIDPLFLNALTVDMGVVIVKSIGGFVPAQIGVEEFGNKYMLALIGVIGPGIWISVSILRRAKQLFWIILSALFYICIEFILPTKKQKHGSIIYNS